MIDVINELRNKALYATRKVYNNKQHIENLQKLLDSAIETDNNDIKLAHEYNKAADLLEKSMNAPTDNA